MMESSAHEGGAVGEHGSSPPTSVRFHGWQT
jgi:hypothetical protein